ncbi:hypothetical protein QQS21_000700 [Conoideocrella luteorostrata]|uniref:Short-chain dehydrogenase n=1 Tax=Conoideocrella luteorostrata TaxID=1105319 RepID=A0AAJ0CYS5_9HYPO|nr:hypothetical protein QQS21_000700 [Conoideocrella luteorostrata]
MGAQWSQFFPPYPNFTEGDVESQDGKVFIITGGSSGIGQQLAKMLYRKKGRVYIAGRSEEKARLAIRNIRHEVPQGGSLEFLQLNLDDLSSIKASVEVFKSMESKLHVLWNNAGVSQPPLGSLSAQGIELQLATNCLGPFLFTTLLLPLLEKGAAESPPGCTRVVWLCSQIVELSSPPGGFPMHEVQQPPKDKTRNYVNSKTGNWFLSSEFARRVGSNGIVSVALNPGAASTNLFRHTPWMAYLAWPLLHKPELAALTELYAGISADVKVENSPNYVVPWGRIGDMRKDLTQATKPREDGGSGRAEEFWRFCENKTQDYL